LPLYSVSKQEATFYYSGLTSNPLLVYRTGTTPWKPPTGPEAYRVLKEVKPVFSHKIATVWGDLGPKVCSCLDSAVGVTWTSVDVVRFAIVGKEPGPPVLWIGVIPQSLSCKDAHAAAVGCQELLKSHEITDVEVEFRESVFTRSTGPKLLKSTSRNPTAGVRCPLTPALGLRIAVRATPYTEGTGALYISDGRDSDKVYILSARHVVFPPNAASNELYHHKDASQPRREVLLPGHKVFQTLLKSTKAKIRELGIMVDYHERQLDNLKENDEVKRTRIEAKLEKEEEAFKAVLQFHGETTRDWSDEDQRVLGHIAYSPPITVGTGTESYTEDWALIELDRNKIDWNTFKGNVIDLGVF